MEAGPSVPTPTATPARRSAATGARPDASLPFDPGQWATATPCAAKSAMSSGVSQTPWAASVRRPKKPRPAR